jgi:C4-dicarboxylate-specific signal transduction histidine kinase
VPWGEWPLPPEHSPARVSLELPGQPPHLLQAGAADTGAGWPLAFEKVLASQSQPFNLVITRRLGWAELPWLAMGGWVVLVLLAAAAWTAWQRQATERRRAEELLRLGQVARLNTLGELAAGLAHELNQPLTAVVANTQAASRLLREQPGTDPTVLGAMAQAVAQARRAAEVVGRLRRVVERPAADDGQQTVVLQDAVRNALHLLEPESRRRQVTPTVDAPSAELRVRADPVALEQIVHNLLMNALQALEQAPPERRELLLRLRADATHGRLDVIDSGPGIPPEAMVKLFQPFFSTREGGLGLGLSLCETLAANMGGALAARNREAGGAEFTLTLPLS